jgi:hypothetical protein
MVSGRRRQETRLPFGFVSICSLQVLQLCLVFGAWETWRAWKARWPIGHTWRFESWRMSCWRCQATVLAILLLESALRILRLDICANRP